MYCSKSCEHRFYRNRPRDVPQFKEDILLLESPQRKWRPVSEFPDYEISNDGRLRRATNGSNAKAGTVLRAKLSRSGYPQYGLVPRDDGKRVNRYAHHLVAGAFLPPAPEGKNWVLHDDDDPLHCIDSNLKWGDRVDNAQDAIKNGRNRWTRSESHPLRCGA